MQPGESEGSRMEEQMIDKERDYKMFKLICDLLAAKSKLDEAIKQKKEAEEELDKIAEELRTMVLKSG